jgi:two-component system, LytTR family, response regulator AlgR
VLNAAPLQLLIADPEPQTRWRLRQHIRTCVQPPCCVVAEAGCASEAWHALARGGVDGVLLDAHLPGSPTHPNRGGLTWAQELREHAAAPGLVMLAHEPAQALAAFEVEAVDCLLKPILPRRLHQALERLAQRRQVGLSEAGRRELADEGRVLTLPGLQQGLRIPVSELVSIQAAHKYLTLHTVHRSHVLEDSLCRLAEELGDAVLRIHRNALVARAAVRALALRPQPDGGRGWAVQVAPKGEWLVVSRRQLGAVRHALGLDFEGR